MEATLTPVWSLGDRLAKSRKMAGIRPEEMAARLGYSRKTSKMSRWENDHEIPRMAVIVAWAQITGVDAEWLLDGLDPTVRSRCFGPDWAEIPGQQHFPCPPVAA